MGKAKYQQEVYSFIAKTPVFNFKSVERIIKSKKKVKQYAKQLVRNLVMSGKIKPLAKGWYTTHNEVSLTVFCFQPAYLGLQDALSFHNMWEQETIPVIITSKKVRTGIREVMGSNVLIRHLNKKYFFGIDYYQQNNYALPYSDLEKTLVDIIYFKLPLDKKVTQNIKKKVNPIKLKQYIRNYPEKVQIRLRKALA